jgi:ABC-type nitrate/sulfonate/bicarbonate transport system substrate-binding protein
MTKFQLTPAGKLAAFIVIAAIVLGATFYMGGFDFLTKKAASTQSAANVPQQAKQVMNISLDEWIGWKPIIDANGGLETKPGSIYDKLGLKVSIKVINDATQSSTALIKGEIDGAGYTVNRFAFLYPKFKENKVQPVMPYITNASSGGDGIIAKSEIKRIEDLVGKSIAVPRFSEAQTLVEWLLSKSDLTADQKKQIKIVYLMTQKKQVKHFTQDKLTQQLHGNHILAKHPILLVLTFCFLLSLLLMLSLTVSYSRKISLKAIVTK